MKPDEPLPLWLESIPDREPWRRGRLAIVFISLCTLLGAAVPVGASIEQGNLTFFLISAGVGLVVPIFLYLIWIGQNWPRWIVAPLFACLGFAAAVWGVVNGDGPQFFAGLFALTVFFYLALAPSVYAFARHQRESIRPAEAALIGGVFLLVVMILGSGLYGFYVYDTDLQRQAKAFAGKAFTQIFVYHDEDFLRANLQERTRRRMTPPEFIASIQNSLGQPRWAGDFRGVFTTRFAARELQMTAVFQIPVLFRDTTPIWVNLEVSRIGDGWQIDRIGWEYTPGIFQSSH
ncbi:MAG: hypothetical protein ACR2NX_14935 [Chthoniobacterales bacterium]